MWTYLAILLSVLAILLVFVRRWILNSREATASKEPAEKAPEEPAEEDEEASKSDKAKAQLLCSKAEDLVKAGKDDEAIKCFVQALALDGLHQETQHKLAVLYIKKQMFSAAAALFKKLAEITKDPVHFSHLGLALYQQGELEGSKDAYQEAVSLDVSRPQRFVSLAQVYKALGQLNNAVVALKKAMEVDQENMDYLFLLTELLIAMGNKRGAGEVLARILKLEPKNKEAKAILKSLDEPEATAN